MEWSVSDWANKKLQEKLTPLAPKTTPIGKLNLSPDSTPKKKKNDQSDVFTGDGIRIATYIGPNATDWNNESYLKAIQLQKQGKNEDEIWKQTRTIMAADGHWWQEISDHKSKLKMKAPEGWQHGGETTLEQVLDAPGLFNSYPHLRNVRVVHDIIGTGGTADGWTTSDGKTIGLRHFPSFSKDIENSLLKALQSGSSRKTTDLTERQKEILYHEIFHAINAAEGRVPPITDLFGPMSPRIRSNISDVTGISKYDVYLGSQFEIPPRDTVGRLTRDDEWRSKNTPRLHGASQEDGGTPKTVVIKKDVKYKDKPGSSYDVTDNPNYEKPPYGKEP